MLYYIKKALTVPFKILLAYISMLSIRSKHVYVFGAWAGEKFADNPKYLFLQASRIDGVTAVWITRNSDIYKTLKAANYKVEMYSSLRGIYYQLRAGVCFTCSHPNDIFIYLLGNALQINLWHGVPLKKIAFDDLKTGIMHQNALNKFLFKIKESIYQFPFRKEYVVSTSAEITRIYQHAFHKKADKVLQLGQPRNDIFYENSLASDTLPFNKKIILYMPTHRASGKKKFDLDKIFDLPALNQLCEAHDLLFVVKKHYYHNKEVENLSAYSNIRDITQNDYDTQQLLKHAALLITDYSSCYIDYLLLDRPIIFYNFDLADYTLNDRELYFDYNAFTPGEKVTTFENLLLLLDDKLAKNYDNYLRERHTIRDFFYAESTQKQVGPAILNEVTRLIS